MAIIIGGGGSGGEANTASNVGAGTGLYASKSGVDLKFKSLTSDGTVTITDGANEVQLASADGGGSGVVKIAEQTVAGTSVSSVDFTSLSLSAYFKVELICRYIKSTTGSNQKLLLRMNGISSGVYSYTGLNNQTSCTAGTLWGPSTDIDINVGVITFYDPGLSTNRKSYISVSENFTTTIVHYDHRGCFQNNLAKVTREAPITQLTLFADSGNIDVGSNFTLIGYPYPT